VPASFLAAQNPRAEAVLPFLDYSQMLEESPLEKKPYAILTGKERDSESGLDFFGARYYSGPQGRFTSPDPVTITKRRLVDPQSLNLYSYVRNGPLNRVDPDGRDWYYYNDKWHWHKGNKAVTYTDSKGKEQTARSRGTGLLVAETTGTNAKGATTYRLTLYDQNKVVATGNGFSGGRDELGRIHNPVRDGNYRILTDHDPTKPTAPRPGDPDNNPPVTYSMQQIDRTLNPYANAAFLAYGPIRARLNPLSGPDVGAYFHGQYNGRGWTHGCLSYGTDTRMIDYMWNSMPNTWIGVGVNEPVVEP
jgi:RHS repeat-associated protein